MKYKYLITGCILVFVLAGVALMLRSSDESLLTGLVAGESGNIWFNPRPFTVNAGGSQTVSVYVRSLPGNLIRSGSMRVTYPAVLSYSSTNVLHPNVIGGSPPAVHNADSRTIEFQFANLAGFPSDSDSELARITFGGDSAGSGELTVETASDNLAGKITGLNSVSVPRTDVELCGNGAVDAGETCSSCPADAGCGAGEVCTAGECQAEDDGGDVDDGGGEVEIAAGNQIANGMFRAQAIGPEGMQIGQFYDFSTQVTALDDSHGSDMFIVTEILVNDQLVSFKKDIVNDGLAAGEQYSSTINYKFNGAFTKKVFVYNENTILSEDGNPLITNYP